MCFDLDYDIVTRHLRPGFAFVPPLRLFNPIHQLLAAHPPFPQSLQPLKHTFEPSTAHLQGVHAQLPIAEQLLTQPKECPREFQVLGYATVCLAWTSFLACSAGRRYDTVPPARADGLGADGWAARLGNAVERVGQRIPRRLADLARALGIGVVEGGMGTQRLDHVEVAGRTGRHHMGAAREASELDREATRCRASTVDEEAADLALVGVPRERQSKGLIEALAGGGDTSRVDARSGPWLAKHQDQLTLLYTSNEAHGSSGVDHFCSIHLLQIITRHGLGRAKKGKKKPLAKTHSCVITGRPSILDSKLNHIAGMWEARSPNMWNSHHGVGVKASRDGFKAITPQKEDTPEHPEPPTMNNNPSTEQHDPDNIT
ncbi:hypothetical protein F4678DRAFT_457505 [Xylaria arbuscula]|nr:hypothetical protein F4678DRAFT_457505 [Xylaria arbuscula]